MPSVSITGFVDGLLRCQLLAPDQCEEVVRLQAKVGDMRELAQELLHRDWLTAYQINQISQGNGAALTIGPFVLLERLGAGGMGQVFKARQRLLNRIVALKLIRKECLDNPRVIRRFQREIRAAGQLSHPHIVRSYDADEVDGQYYISMELIDGVDLARLVRDHGPLAVDQACDYIRQAALGLQHAHERGLVHRDIKPANLLVTRRRRSSSPAGDAVRSTALIPRSECHPWGIVKILDLGLARCTDSFSEHTATSLSQSGAVMGTPEYIAPEQARDSDTSDIRADLYSLGCTLYFLLTGQPPFPTGTLTEKLLKHQIEEAPAVAEKRREGMRPGTDEAALRVPAIVDELVRRMLSKRPEDRWETPLELAKEVQAILQKLAAETQIETPIDLAKTQPLTPADIASFEPASDPPTDDGPIVILRSQPARPEKLAGRFAVLCTALGVTAVLSFLAVVAALMSGGNSGRANTKDVDEIKVTSPKR